jgi:TonB-dependent SusC/RagA subfamily outer membrane receptor
MNLGIITSINEKFSLMKLISIAFLIILFKCMCFRSMAQTSTGNSSKWDSQKSNVMIICQNSLAPSKEPLIIINGRNGRPMDFLNLSPKDISNIYMLKGSEATAIYGSLSVNGVIVIQTFKGRYSMKQRKSLCDFPILPIILYEIIAL